MDKSRAFQQPKPIIEVLMARLLAGDVFEASSFNEGMADLAVASSLIVIDSDVELICSFFAYSEGSSFFNVYEAPTVTDAGAVDVSLNMNRRSDDTSKFQVSLNPIVSDKGSLIFERYVPGGSGGNAGGGKLNKDLLVLLKAGEKYLFEFQNRGGAAKDIFGGCTIIQTKVSPVA